mgnify:CR=1 FL=1
MRRRSSLCFYNKITIFMEKHPFCSHYITKLFSVAPLVKNCHREKKPLCPGSFPRAAGARCRAFLAAADPPCPFSAGVFFLPGACFLRGGAPSGEEIINIM